jgi:hypothetical protein
VRGLRLRVPPAGSGPAGQLVIQAVMPTTGQRRIDFTFMLGGVVFFMWLQDLEWLGGEGRPVRVAHFGNQGKLALIRKQRTVLVVFGRREPARQCWRAEVSLSKLTAMALEVALS